MPLSSCGDKKDEPKNPEDALIGTWICRNFDYNCDYIMCFKNDGTGWMRWTDYNETEDFSYRVNGGRIKFYSYDGYSSKTWECDFEIRNNNNLTIYGNPWGEDDDINVVQLVRQ